MLYVGLDYHPRTSALCILNQDGKTVKQRTVRGRIGDVAEALAADAAELGQQPLEVVFEATGGYGPVHEQLSKVAHRVVMAHPGQLRLIWAARRKHDRLDAQKLAKLLYCDAIPQAHVPPAATRQWRRLIELRRSLVRRRAALKNQVHALLRTCGLIAPSKPSLFAKAGIAWLERQQVDEVAALERTVLVEQMRAA